MNLDPETHARIAVLEAQHRDLKSDMNDMRRELRTADAEIAAKLEVLIKAHTKYQGIIGGIMLVGSLIATFLSIAGESIAHWVAETLHGR